MSVGAICFTSSGSNGGCWVVLVFLRLFFLEKWVFLSHTRLTPKKKKFTRLTPKKKISVGKKNVTYASKKKLRDLRQKKKATYAYFHNPVTLSSMRSALQGDMPDRVGEGGGVPTPLRRRREEEDNCGAPAAFHRGRDQERRGLRWAEARDRDFVSADSSSGSESSSSERSSSGSPSKGSRVLTKRCSSGLLPLHRRQGEVGGGNRTFPKGWLSPARSATLEHRASAIPRAPSSARYAISVSATSSCPTP